MRSCLSLVGCGTLVAAALVAGWFARDEIAGLAGRVVGGPAEEYELANLDEPAIARRVEAKVVGLGQGETDEVRLSGAELDAWMRQGLKGFFPGFVSDVDASIADEQLLLAGQVALRDVPGIDGLGPVAALFGDSAAVQVQGRLDGLGPGVGVYYVDEIKLGLISLPEAMRDNLLVQLKGGSGDGLPLNAVAFELPRFVSDVGVREDYVFLRGSRAAR